MVTASAHAQLWGHTQMHTPCQVTTRSLSSSCHPHFLLQPFALNSHQQSPVNAHLMVTGWVIGVTSSSVTFLLSSGDTVPVCLHHSQFSAFHLKIPHGYIFMHLFPHKSFCSPLLLLKQISEYFSISLVRNIPVLSRNMSKNNDALH